MEREEEEEEEKDQEYTIYSVLPYRRQSHEQPQRPSQSKQSALPGDLTDKVNTRNNQVQSATRSQHQDVALISEPKMKQSQECDLVITR